MRTRLPTPRLDALVADGTLPGFSVSVREGGTLLHAVGGTTEPDGSGRAVDEDTAYRLASLSKPVAALLAAGLVAEGLLSPEDPVARWLPELDRLTVLPAPDAPLEAAGPLRTTMTVAHLLTMTSGLGIGAEATPLSAAMAEAGVHPGPVGPRLSREEVLARLAALPLAFPPGAGWAYHTSTDVLGLVLERAAGARLPELLAARLTGPLDAPALGFDPPPADRRAAPFYSEDGAWHEIEPEGPATDALPTLSCGLWGTAADTRAVLDELVRPRTLAPEAVAAVRRPALTDRQRRSAGVFLPPGYSYGWQVSVALEDDAEGPRAGSVGWSGGTGTLGIADPAADRTSVLLTNRGLEGPRAVVAFTAFLADVHDRGDRPAGAPGR
ncbi:serine hydrolase domain-containing protein [Phycicoccus flavus]|uniref:serine hydrolase domain-containing protein n=1 Tax=Phycicoccus flavus TaxID=2502783 RepID=UPI000FEBAEC2|nr:serine hydrolase domain-containing protein [Phycicoccus flavus]NHA67275.1 beta-lactamase family protein [Phycicoccus flavus]